MSPALVVVPVLAIACDGIYSGERGQYKIEDRKLPAGIAELIPQEFDQKNILNLVQEDILPRLIPAYQITKNDLASFNFSFRTDNDFWYVDGSGKRSHRKYLGVSLSRNFDGSLSDRVVYQFEFMDTDKGASIYGERAFMAEAMAMRNSMSRYLINGLNESAKERQALKVTYRYYA